MHEKRVEEKKDQISTDHAGHHFSLPHLAWRQIWLAAYRDEPVLGVTRTQCVDNMEGAFLATSRKHFSIGTNDLC